MPTKQFLMSGTTDDPAVDGSTEYSTLLGDGKHVWTATEEDRTSLISTPGKLTNFKVGVRTAPGAGKSWTFTVRKGSAGDAVADTTLIVTIANAAKLSALDTDEVAVVAGDRVSISAVGTGTPTAAAAVYWTCQFTPTTDGETILLGNSAGVNLTLNRYHSLIGAKAVDAAELIESQTLFPTAGTLKNFYVELGTAPGGTENYRFTIRVNAVDKTLVVIVTGANTTGNDIVNTVAIAAGDAVSIKVTTSTGAPAASIAKWGVTFLPDVQGEYIAAANSMDTSAPNAVDYQHLNCGDSTYSWDEPEFHCIAQETTAKAIYVKLSSAPEAGMNWIFTLRDDLQDTAETVTITNPATSGNAAVDVAIVADSLINSSIDASAGANVTRVCIAFLFYNAPTSEGAVMKVNNPRFSGMDVLLARP